MDSQFRTRRSPLTRARLRTLWERNPSPEVRALLWEVHRLRMLVLASQRVALRISAAGDFSRLDLTTQTMIDELRGRLIDEPVCQEESDRDAERARLRYGKGSRR
jgi:hypothetical protein